MTARCPQCDQTEQDCADHIESERAVLREQQRVYLDGLVEMETREMQLAWRLDEAEAVIEAAAQVALRLDDNPNAPKAATAELVERLASYYATTT